MSRVFLGAVILIVVVSSVYDFYLEKTKKGILIQNRPGTYDYHLVL